MKITEKIFIVLLIFLSFYYLYLASQTAFLGEDEAAYFNLGKEFLKSNYNTFSNIGLPYVIPPFMPLLFSFSFFIFGASLGITKIITCILGILTLFVVYLIGKKVNFIAGISSVVILLSIPMFTQYLFITYVEIPIAFFSALSLYLFLTLDSMKKSILLGVILGLSSYVKSDGSFLIIALFAFTLILYLVRKDKHLFKLVLISCLIAFIIILPWIIRNLYLHHYPFVEGLNLFFNIKTSPGWITPNIWSMIVPSTNFITLMESLGLIAVILGVLGSTYGYLSKERTILLSVFMTVLFLFFFIFLRTGESRYLSIIFPQLALAGGMYLGVLHDKINKSINVWLSYALVGIVILFCLYSSLGTAISISQSQRYPSNYIEALTWIKNNTPANATIFTAYGGSVRIFADRDIVWNMIEEFPDIMTAQNGTYISETLKKYNVTYILIWRGIVAQNYIIPQSNLLGAFTYNFISVVQNDKEHFETSFQNADNLVLKII